MLGLALPALAQQYLYLLVRFSDQYIAGCFKLADESQREVYLASLNTAGYLYWFVSSYTILVSVGATALVARFTGGNDWPLARRASGQSILLALAFGVVGALAGLTELSSLVEALQLRGDAALFCVQFLTPLAIVLPFQIVESACISCFAGAGDTRTGLKVLGFIAVLNIPLAWTLSVGVGPWPGFGFVGIAIGTGLSHVAGCVILLVLLGKGRSGLKLGRADLRPDFGLLRRLLRVSVPAGIDSLSVAVCQLWFLRLVNQLGNTAAAAHGIAIQWEALGYLAGGAFGTAAMTLVGQNLGALNPARAGRGAAVSLLFGVGVMVAMGLAFVVLAEPMFRLFCRQDQTLAVIEEGVPVLRLIACCMPALATQIIFTSALRGAGDTRVPILISWFGFLGVRIPLAYLLTGHPIPLSPFGELELRNMGLFGAWVAMCIDIWVRGTFFAIRFWRGKWKRHEV